MTERCEDNEPRDEAADRPRTGLMKEILRFESMVRGLDDEDVILRRICQMGLVLARCERTVILWRDSSHRLAFAAGLDAASENITDSHVPDGAYECLDTAAAVVSETSDLFFPMGDENQQTTGVLWLHNHINDDGINIFPSYMHDYLQLFASFSAISLSRAKTVSLLKHSWYQTVARFVRACEFHDRDTGGHIERIGNYSALLYQKLGFPSCECEVLRLAGMLHDVGKIAIPDSILKKPGLLTPEERLIMQSHAQAGHDMIVGTGAPVLELGAVVAGAHHEKWDGSGYPQRLRGDDIPLVGRIVAIADVFDALSFRRVYKDAWPLERVLDTIQADSGRHFDPSLVKLFFGNLDEILEIRDKITADRLEFAADRLPKAS